MINALPIQTAQAKIRKEHSHRLFLSHIQNIHKIVRNRGLKCPANSMHVSISALLLIQALASTIKTPAGLPASHLVHLYSVLHKADRDLSRNANRSVLLCRELPVAFHTLQIQPVLCPGLLEDLAGPPSWPHIKPHLLRLTVTQSC